MIALELAPSLAMLICLMIGIAAKSGNKFRVEIASNGKRYGYIYDTLEEAIKARDIMAWWHHGDFKR